MTWTRYKQGKLFKTRINDPTVQGCPKCLVSKNPGEVSQQKVHEMAGCHANDSITIELLTCPRINESARKSCNDSRPTSSTALFVHVTTKSSSSPSYGDASTNVVGHTVLHSHSLALGMVASSAQHDDST